MGRRAKAMSIVTLLRNTIKELIASYSEQRCPQLSMNK